MKNHHAGASLTLLSVSLFAFFSLSSYNIFMRHGLCKMCLSEKDLVLSHLMAAALYDYCRAPGCSPVRVGGRAYPTDRQVAEYLLCSDCENVLSREGETWVIPRLATMDRSFPLFESLTKQPPALSEDGADIYCAANNPEIKAEKLAHFAMGMFWKAAVHSWRCDDRITNIELGPYAEGIRRWLLGEGRFPERICLQIAVSTPGRAQILFINPYEGRRSEWHSFFVYVLGVLFVIHVGKQVRDASELCFRQNAAHPIWIWDKIHADFEMVFANQYKNVHKTRALLKAKEARDRALAASAPSPS